MKKLVIFKKDWADEFDCEQFKVMSLGEYDEWLTARDTCEYCEYSFGTNEYFEVDEIDDDSFEVLDITDTQAFFLEETLGKTFGTGIIECFN